MNNESVLQKISVNLILSFLKFLNFIDFEIKWVLFVIFTFSLSLTFWNYKDFGYHKLFNINTSPLLHEDRPVEKLEKNTFLLSPKIINDVNVQVTKPPEKILKVKPLNLLARGYLIYDYKNQREIDSKNKDETLPPASLVKLLSVMYFSQGLDLNTRFKMTPECTQVNGQKVGFRVGEEISVRDLIYSSLIFSGADSVCLLSRTNSGYDITGFNKFTFNLGLFNSNFTNYIGLDYTNNYTTAQDMLKATLLFLKNDTFSDIVKLKTYKLENQRVIINTNKMLFENKYSVGIKTGTTDGANENLIYRYKKDEDGIDLIVVILNSANRYSDIRQIISNLYFDY